MQYCCRARKSKEKKNPLCSMYITSIYRVGQYCVQHINTWSNRCIEDTYRSQIIHFIHPRMKIFFKKGKKNTALNVRWSSHRCTARHLQVVRCCHVKVLIAELQNRDRWPPKRASRNLWLSPLTCSNSQPKEAVTAAGPRVQPGTQSHGPRVFLQASRRHSVGTCHLFASCILSIGSIQYPVSCTRLHLQSASLVPPSTCSIQSPRRTVTCRAAFCSHLLCVVLPTQTENGDGRRGEWKTVGANLAQPWNRKHPVPVPLDVKTSSTEGPRIATANCLPARC